MITLSDSPQIITSPLGANLLQESSGIGEYQELCWRYLHKLPANLKLGQIKCQIDSDYRYEFDSRLFVDESDGPVGQLMLTLYRKPGGAYDDIYLELEQCQIWYPNLRGKGLGRAIVELVMNLGRRLGAKAITAIAIYDGRFVWPVLGFRFGDYLPEEKAAQKFQRRFVQFCNRQGIVAPDVSNWDAPDFAQFTTDLLVSAPVGHSMDREQQLVGFGRAFLLSRRPFFLSYPLL